jgi:hypothetical protein
MSVRTTADEKVDQARHHIQEAIGRLSEIVINRCHGTSEYTEKYLNKLQQTLIGLLDIRDSF